MEVWLYNLNFKLLGGGKLRMFFVFIFRGGRESFNIYIKKNLVILFLIGLLFSEMRCEKFILFCYM